MKKVRWLMAASGLLLCNLAEAQSSVTLYGLIHDALDITTNAGGHTGYQMAHDIYFSRWGLRGSENLGDGLKAIFTLESGFNVNNGTVGQSTEFGRQAFVGLSSAQYGTFTMGRQYDATIDMWSGFTAAGSTIGDLASHPYDNDNADYDYHVLNSVKYVSPTYAGFTGEGVYGFSNATGFADNRMYSLAGSYKHGGFAAAVAYMRFNNAGTTTTGAGAAQVFTSAAEQNIDVGASYTFANNALVGIAYSQVDVYNPVSNVYFATQPAAGSQNSWKFNNFEINGRYYLKPDLWLAGAYTYTFARVATTSGNFMPKW
ncbi:MAG: porin, partial [Janthinobacterium lividum]